MKTIEEKAQAYTDSTDTMILGCEENLDATELIQKGYIAGATETLARQWLNVDDELPEMRQRVLICLKERNATRTSIVISKRIPFASDNPDNPRWEWSNVREEDVIAWMTLPKPPKAEKP